LAFNAFDQNHANNKAKGDFRTAMCILRQAICFLSKIVG